MSNNNCLKECDIIHVMYDMITPSMQDICNGRGVCECGACICQAPYFGEFCELCSGDPICQPRTCAPDGDNARCASCVIDLLDVLNDRDFGFNLFTPEVLLNATLNGSLPDGTFLTQVMIDEMIVAALELPEDFSADCSSAVNASCPQFVVINDTLEMEYEIQSKSYKPWAKKQSGRMNKYGTKESFLCAETHRYIVHSFLSNVNEIDGFHSVYTYMYMYTVGILSTVYIIHVYLAISE